MDTYASALLIAIPVFVLLLLLETVYGYWAKKETPRLLDIASSLSSGLTNILKDSLGLALILVSYPFLFEHFALIQLPSGFIVYAVAFIAKDFASYLYHLLSHKVNLFWNEHIIHHSSEEFNLGCALRQPISNIISIFALFLFPAALLGVPPKVMAIVAPLHLFLQFWYHTKYIGKLGWLEYIIVTPSQHRVHHAINDIYIDKNLSPIFCIWDRWFGTFQEELDDVPPVYGVRHPVQTWNPIKINFQHLWQLAADAWHTKNYTDKLRIWFMPTGWRPTDVIQKYPIASITDVYAMQKYDYNPSGSLFAGYAIFQVMATTLLTMLLFYQYSAIGFNGLLGYAALLFVGIYGYTSLMDGDPAAPWIETARGIAGLTLIAYIGNWANINVLSPYGSYWVAAYYLLTIAAAHYFNYRRIPKPVDRIMMP